MKTLPFLIIFYLSALLQPIEPGDPRMIFHDFTEGTVYLKDRSQVRAKLNYDAYDEQMIFVNNNQVMALANPELIDRVTIGERTFYWLEKDIFLEKIDSASIVIYKRHRRQMRSEGKETSFGGVTQTQAVSTIERLNRSSDNASASLEQKESFRFENDDLFYLYADGKFESLATPKQIAKFFRTNKKSLASYMQSHAIDLQNSNDVIQLIQFCRKTAD